MFPWAEMDGLRCEELADLIEKRPIVYIPNGIYEWHEAQNPMGTDTIKVMGRSILPVLHLPQQGGGQEAGGAQRPRLG
jgi:hypothetical protein